ncbi:hypothetical protein FOL47_005917 [Perkinsus chesapeaki]|uniref:Uncharacterized protein n=1 Tax=Perkinsus chesapeaki TaxID=330153 RepID=A0A7J6LW94_PERCH|nr:hypothetical protein FOL47_005917 [Perkinsus chesapeaki]
MVAGSLVPITSVKQPKKNNAEGRMFSQQKNLNLFSDTAKAKAPGAMKLRIEPAIAPTRPRITETSGSTTATI